MATLNVCQHSTLAIFNVKTRPLNVLPQNCNSQTVLRQNLSFTSDKSFAEVLPVHAVLEEKLFVVGGHEVLLGFLLHRRVRRRPNTWLHDAVRAPRTLVPPTEIAPGNEWPALEVSWPVLCFCADPFGARKKLRTRTVEGRDRREPSRCCRW